MRKRTRTGVLIVAVTVGCAVLGGCHADENDPKGLAEELADPVRREWAIGHLQRIFGQRLGEAKGNREAAPIVEFNEVTHQHLTKVYIEHPEDSSNGYRIVQLMSEMRDPRTLPALLEALKWRTEVSENHAIAAAKTLRQIEIPDEKRAAVVEAVAGSLSRVDGKRGADNRMRKAFIEALGDLGDQRATKVLIEVATRQDEAQNFLFNLLAARQLARLRDPAAIEPMIRALYLFAPNNPAMRMNDAASSVLVAIGRPALAPLLELLKGNNKAANKIAAQYIAAIRERDPNAAATMDAGAIVGYEATFTLGKLGYREAMDALLAETKVKHEGRRNAAAIALVSLNRSDADTAKVVGAIKR
ncbi:MAG: hypothetical protein MJD61_19075, partial [Proteobacteria bacterium]|nr:hypothetical protein [Pseudomonadota bacterium]